MKFSLATFLVTSISSALSSSVSDVRIPDNLSVKSPIGQSILQNARRLENEVEGDFSWVADYSIKFQGCHHITQWNAEADGQDDVRIATKRLIRFRLCPTDYCNSGSSSGCDSGYGDYIIDMGTYLMAYMENKEALEEDMCDYLDENVCVNCQGVDDEEGCMNDCYEENGADYCIEGDDDGFDFEVAEYLQCDQFNANRRRRLADDDGTNTFTSSGNQNVDHFIGPYCADDGGKVLLGVFLDDACTNFADSYSGKSTYYRATGDNLPYGDESILGLECVSCAMQMEDDVTSSNSEDMTNEMCQYLYATAGKCENIMNIDNPNDNACNFMKGIKMVRNDGVVSSAQSGSKTAATFIGVFAAAFFLVSGYAYYLKTKLDKINLN